MSTAAERRLLLTAVCRLDDASSSPASAKATAPLLAALATGDCSLTALVLELQGELTDVDEDVRRRALVVLSDALQVEAVGRSVGPPQAHSLVSFLEPKLSDQRSAPPHLLPIVALPRLCALSPSTFSSRARVSLVKEALHCLLALLRCSAPLLSSEAVAALNATSVRRAIAALVLELPVQSFVQSVRRLVLDCLSVLWAVHPSLLTRGGVSGEGDLLDGFVSVVDGEKDPRCLVVAFALTAFLLPRLSPEAVQLHSEAVFDVVGCYFPITFSPPVNDPHHISTEELQVGLRAALTSHPALLPHLLPLVLEKAEDTVSSVQLDALLTLRSALQPPPQLQSQWRRAVLPFCGEMQASLKRLWLQPGEGRVELSDCLTQFVRLLCPDEDGGEDEGGVGGVQSGGESVVSAFRSALFADLVEELRVADSKVARAYASMTGPICRASHAAFTAWTRFLCPALIHRLRLQLHSSAAASDTQRQALLHHINLLLHIQAEADSGEGHITASPPLPSPLAPYADELMGLYLQAIDDWQVSGPRVPPSQHLPPPTPHPHTVPPLIRRLLCAACLGRQSRPTLFSFACEGASVLSTLHSSALPSPPPPPSPPSLLIGAAPLARLVSQLLTVWSREEAESVSAAALRALVVVARSHPTTVAEVALPSLLTWALPPSSAAGEAEGGVTSVEGSGPSASSALPAVAGLAVAHPSLLLQTLPPLLRRLHRRLPSAISGSPPSLDGVLRLLSALALILQHYTDGRLSPTASSSPSPSPVVLPLLPPSYPLHFAVYLSGLLYSTAVQLLPSSAPPSEPMGRLVGCVLPSLCSLTATLDVEAQRRLFELLLPALVHGPAEPLLAAFRLSAVYLAEGDAADADLLLLPSPPSSLLSAVPPLLSRCSPLPLRHLLVAFSSLCGCSRVGPDSPPQPLPLQLVEAVASFVRSPASPNSPQPHVGHSAVVHLLGALLNKLPLDHPHLTDLINQAVLWAFVELEKQTDGAGEGGRCTELLNAAAVSVKALSMRLHPLSAPLLSRYLSLIDTSSAIAHSPAALSAWAFGFSLLVLDFPLLLSRRSHAVQGVGLVYKQRLLALALPTLQQRVQEEQKKRRNRAEGVRKGEEEETRDGKELLSALLHSVLFLVQPLPWSVLMPKVDVIVPLVIASTSHSTSSHSRSLALHTLHRFLQQPKMDSHRLLDYTSTLIQFLRFVVEGKEGVSQAIPAAVSDVICALQCLSSLHRLLPYSALYSHRVEVLKALTGCVDVESRRVRREAIQVRTEWLMTTK